MFSFLFGKKSPPRNVVVEGREAPLVVKPKETILEAALREGLPFPNDCRVGACATCKCRLLEGEVDEKSEKAYVLSSDELKGGYILACQSVPKTDLRIAVDDLFAREATHRVVKTQGTLVERRALTADTAELVLRVEQPLVYSAGQYARIRLPSVSSEDRSYSFARAPRTAAGETELVFFVREVPGGALSPALVRGDVVGQRVEVEGPLGDFGLHPGDAPLLLIAGGSGLAPIRALLEELGKRGDSRPVALLFGARTEQDLYEVAALEDIGRSLVGGFRFVPILSHEPEGSRWNGQRGLVTAAIAAHVHPAGQAYLCGPPPMIDAAIVELAKNGVSADRVFFDKFTDKSHAAAPR